MSFRCILSAVIFVFSEGLILQGPSSPLVAQLGGVLRLPCSVETPLPLDELEVEWRRADSKALVHLFQEGESRPESQSDAYRDRAHFFTEREIANGNYSLLLRNVTTDDAGTYSCGVYTNEETGEIAVEIEIEAIERLVLTGADHAVTANVGEEVILNCSVESHIPPEEVSWAKVDSDESHMLVLLFQDNETYPGDSSYQGRTEFFTSEIPKGNFSLRLKDVRTEDKGEYICKAHSGLLSANTTVILQGLGLSSMHILVLVLCGSAFVVALVVFAMILLDIKERQKMRTCEVKYEYSAMEDGELDMVKGEIIEILQKDDWSLGKHNGKVGLFPSKRVQKMSTFQETGKVMKSKVRWKYSAKKDDELDLVAGETIEILEVIDDEWYRGNYNGKVGLFPSHLVQEISPLQGKVMNGKVLHGYSAVEDDELDLAVGETIGILKMDNRKWSLGKHNGKVGLFPLSDVREISALQKRQTMRKCEVLRKYSAMEDGELDMVEGEIIEILQKDGWSLGKHNGKVGLLPSNCIQEMSTFQETGKVMKSKVRWKHSAKKDDELDLVAGETIEILEIVNRMCRGNYNGKVGLFPSHLVQEISPLQGKVMQGKVLHGYSAMKDEELDLVAGETIEILQMDNRKWSLGKHKGKVGLFPLSDVREIPAFQDITQRALRMHYVLVFGPSVLMFTAFVLWGIIEGFLSEVVICSTLNLIRFIMLFKTSLYQKKLPEMIKTIIKKSSMFEYIIVVSVLCYVIFYSVWSIERESKGMAFIGIIYGSSLHMGMKIFCRDIITSRWGILGWFRSAINIGIWFYIAINFLRAGSFMYILDFSYLFTMSFLSRTFSETAFISMFAGMFVVPVSNWILIAIVAKKYPFLGNSSFFPLFLLGWMTLARLIISVVVFYFFDQILESNEERAGLLSVTALLQLLALAGLFDSFSWMSDWVAIKETPRTILYMYGAVGVVAVNAITLTTELILKSRKGQRTLTDLRVIVLPFECVFVLSWIALWTHAFCTSDLMTYGIKQEVAILRRYGSRRWLKFLRDGAKPSEAFEMLFQSAPPPAGSDTPQASPPEPPPEAETEIHSIGNVPEDTDTNSPGQVGKNDSHLPDTTPERAEEDCKVEANADTDGHTTGSPLSVDVHINAHSCETITSENDSLLNHGQSVVPTDFTKPRDSSAQESSPLLGKDISESVPPSET